MNIQAKKLQGSKTCPIDQFNIYTCQKIWEFLRRYSMHGRLANFGTKNEDCQEYEYFKILTAAPNDTTHVNTNIYKQVLPRNYIL